MRFISKICLFLIFGIFTAATYSQNENKTTIAALNLDMRDGVPANYQAMFSDILRDELFQTGKFRVLERIKMEEILAEVGFQMSGCASDECIIAAGQMLGVEQMVAGSIGKIGTLYVISIRLIDVETGELISTGSSRHKGSIEDVALKSLNEAVLQITGEKEADKPPASYSTQETAVPSSGNFTESDDYLQGIIDGKKYAEGKISWVFGGICCGCFGVGGAYYLSETEVPSSMLIGKPTDYVLGFTDAYKKEARKKNTTYALIGWSLWILAGLNR
ncbi:MAG: CsgG/HfaB family protein [Candidatus Electryonea clarkiae]|nr:CsgG/HfaB family protein [Candidatus Electryonea clarkiae]MDP8285036.1 CsgG/HfaB family protein [Candidatus Electryonea clarkiae]